MKHFPIYSQGICLGVALVFLHNNMWHLRYLRDDRHGPTFTLAEIAEYATSGNVEYAAMLAKIGYVIRDIEEYTGCPVSRVPIQRRNHGQEILFENVRNPFLRMVRIQDSPWIADFMIPWVVSGRVVFENVPSDNTMIFTIEDDVRVKIRGSSSLVYCKFEQQDSELLNVQAAFCTFHKCVLHNQSIHNGYVFGTGDNLRVCA